MADCTRRVHRSLDVKRISPQWFRAKVTLEYEVKADELEQAAIAAKEAMVETILPLAELSEEELEWLEEAISCSEGG